MGIETALGIGGSILGGVIGAEGAESAAETQAGAAREANALTQRQFNQMRTDLSPYRSSGESANNLLSVLLGLKDNIPSSMRYGNEVSYGALPSSGRWREIYNEVQAKRAPGTDYDTVQIRDEASRLYANEMAEQNPQYGSLLQNFTGQDLQNEPGYQFGLTEGQKGLDRRQLAGGNYLSGGALKAASRYNQEYANTKFDNAFNRDSANKNRLYSMLSGVSNSGQNSAAMTGQAGLNAANSIGNNIIGAGNAQAAGQVGAANAIGNGISGAVNAYQWNQLLSNNKTSTPDWTTPGYGWNGGYSDY